MPASEAAGRQYQIVRKAVLDLQRLVLVLAVIIESGALHFLPEAAAEGTLTS